MALQMDYTLPGTSVVISDAYWRIDNIHGGKQGFHIFMKIYSSQAEYNFGDTSLGYDEFDFMPDVDSAGFFIETEVDSSGFTTYVALNFVAQGYEYLKTLGQFFSATNI